jgi:hypothetical protein
MCRAVGKLHKFILLNGPNRKDSGRKHSKDVVPGKEHTAYNQKMKTKITFKNNMMCCRDEHLQTLTLKISRGCPFTSKYRKR